MKKMVLTVLSVAWLMTGYTHAQNKSVKKSKPIAEAMPAESASGTPVVRLGTIETATTSREKILAYPRLLPQSIDCEVMGYDFAMTANGKSWGPVTVKGAVLNEEIKDRIKAEEPSNIKISITSIRVKCGSEEAMAKPINIEYNH